MNWDEYRAEEEHRERMRKQDEARRKGPYSNDIHTFVGDSQAPLLLLPHSRNLLRL